VTRVVVVGAAGRMGRAIAETAASDPGFELKAGVDRAPRPGSWNAAWGWSDDLAAVLAPGDVVVEFTSPAGAAETAGACAARGAGLVSGSTGLSDAEEEAMRRAAAKVAVLRSANFSLGILALRRALRSVLSALPAWEVEIVERHHRAKQDSPSGTAMALARDVMEIRGDPVSSLRHGREGRVGPRPRSEIGIHAVRGGTWVGDHAVLIAGEGEWLELRHVAQDRAAFARGALAAAELVAKSPPGLYTFEAVLSAVPGRKEA
jgi:4-hydroxy-tetrahydrodipicolinate reductase